MGHTDCFYAWPCFARCLSAGLTSMMASPSRYIQSAVAASSMVRAKQVHVSDRRCTISWLGVAARVEQVFAWGVCRVSYRTPESDHKVIVKSLRIEDLIPADVGNRWVVSPGTCMSDCLADRAHLRSPFALTSFGLSTGLGCVTCQAALLPTFPGIKRIASLS